MSSHNTKPEFGTNPGTYREENEQDELCVYKRTLIESSQDAAPEAPALELSLSDDFDGSNDPYNSTGRHVIIKAKLALED